MAKTQYTFKRYEKKYLLSETQFLNILTCLKEKMIEDEYGLHTICNIYFDTDLYELIRNSVDKPVYKEKFRLRSYGIPDSDDKIFAEIKKKYDGIVYKRRIAATTGEIKDFLSKDKMLKEDRQIQHEIQWLFNIYHPKPKVFIGYERIALLGKEMPDLRVTFDRNIRWRRDNLDLRQGDYGELILPENKVIMEIKTPDTMPLWLTSILSEKKIYPTSFSKYGTCYLNNIALKEFKKG